MRRGYERVIRPRFADARFFYEEDLKQGLESMRAGLENVTYQAKLGSYADKSERVALLAERSRSRSAPTPRSAARRALSKADLQSRMVGGFRNCKASWGVLRRRHGRVGRGPDAIDHATCRVLPATISRLPPAQVLAVAERLDKLASGFGAGLKPSGTRIPSPAPQRTRPGAHLIEGELKCRCGACSPTPRAGRHRPADVRWTAARGGGELADEAWRSTPRSSTQIAAPTTPPRRPGAVASCMPRARTPAWLLRRRGVSAAHSMRSLPPPPESWPPCWTLTAGSRRSPNLPPGRGAGVAAANKRIRNICARARTRSRRSRCRPAPRRARTRAACAVTPRSPTPTMLAARTTSRAAPAGDAARAGGRLLRRRDGHGRGPCAAPQPPRPAQGLADRFAAVAAVEHLSGP